MTDDPHDIRKLKEHVADNRRMLTALRKDFALVKLALEALERRSYKPGASTIVVRGVEGLTDEEALYGVRADV